jgi:PAS domain S-box-containing protein
MARQAVRPSRRLSGDPRRFLELFTRAPVAYLRLDLDGRVRELNPAAVRLLRSPGRQIIGRSLVECVDVSDRPRLLDYFRTIGASSKPRRDEFAFRIRGGANVRLLLSAWRSVRPGPRTCWAVLEDVSERHRLIADQRAAEARHEQVERERTIDRARSEAKDQFLATLSHELRTPLTPALLASTLLPQIEALSPRGADMVAAIRRNIETEARLIDDLLDVTRIARGKMQIERRAVDLHAVLRDSVAVCAPDAAARRISIRLSPRAANPCVSGDATRLGQVFWNLLKNAIKFTEPGGSVEVMTTDVAPGAIGVEVVDTGIGSDPGAGSTIFRPFEQAGAAGDRGGLGLGLAICHGIVTAHGGQIEARSEGPGRGACLSVRLPALPAPISTDRMPDAPEAGRPGSLRILLVEDHVDSLEMMTALLESEGHQVTTATTLAAALLRLDQPWDCVISDIDLPDGSGLEIGHALGRLAHRPLGIALSGYGSTREIQQSRAAGFHEHLVKPLPLMRLRELLRGLSDNPHPER